MGLLLSSATPLPDKPTAARHALAYQPALDGIRALAVAAVLAYHAGLPWARGGFLGVDAFFVLSGYLITSLLLTEHRSRGRIDLVAFWARRARRLLPALFLMLCGVAAYALVFAGPEEIAALRADGLATIGYVANWRPVFAGESYFEQFAVPSALRHTWSLAIEEQWYLVWPPLLLGLLSLRRVRGLLLIAPLVMVAVSVLLMAGLHDPSDPSRVYFGTDTRAQSLLVGALLAALLVNGQPLRPLARYALEALAALCAAYLGWRWATVSGDSQSLYQGGFLLLALAVAVIIVAAVQPRGIVRRALSLAPLRGLGIISYGVYLWHWPVYLVLTPDRTGWDGYGLFAARVTLTLAVSAASYYLLERPFRRGVVLRWRPSWALAPAGALSIALVVLFATSSRPSSSVLSAASVDAPLPIVPTVVAGPADNPPPPLRVLLIGDSVAATLGLGLERTASQANMLFWNKSSLGCGFARSEEILVRGEWKVQRSVCWDWWNAWPSYVDSFQPDVVVMLFGAWDISHIRSGGRTLEFLAPESDSYLLGELHHTISVLSAHGARIVLLTTPYFQERDLGLDVGNGRFEPDHIDHINALYREAARQRYRQVEVVDLNAFLAALGESANGKEIRFDGVHFSSDGADLVAGWLTPQIEAAREAGSSALSENGRPDAAGS